MMLCRFVLALTCVVFFAGCERIQSSRANGSAEPAAENEVREAGRNWDQLFNRGDAASLAALYAEDAISMPPNSPTVSGRKAIQAEFESFFAGNVARHETMVDQVLISGNLTIEVARYRLTYKPRSGGSEVVETGRHMETRRKIDGQWKIVLEIWNSDTPAPK